MLPGPGLHEQASIAAKHPDTPGHTFPGVCWEALYCVVPWLWLSRKPTHLMAITPDLSNTSATSLQPLTITSAEVNAGSIRCFHSEMQQFHPCFGLYNNHYPVTATSPGAVIEPYKLSQYQVDPLSRMPAFLGKL